MGIFYDPLTDRVDPSYNPPLNNGFTISGYNLAPGEGNNLFKVASDSNAGFVNGFTSGKTLAQIQASDRSFSPPGITVLNRKTHSPQYQKWSLELQRAFGTSTSVSVGYYGNHGIQQQQVLPDGQPNPQALYVQTGCETGFNKGNLPGASGPCGWRPCFLCSRAQPVPLS